MPTSWTVWEGHQSHQTKDSWDWLTKGKLKHKTESLLIAAQEQALNTNSEQKNIYQQVNLDKCKPCRMGVENVTHIINTCGMLAQKEYKCCHNKLATHWCLCRRYNLEVKWKTFCYKPEKVTKNNQVKILWSFNIQTDCTLKSTKPNITAVENKYENTSSLVTTISRPKKLERLKSRQSSRLMLPEYGMFKPVLSC